MNRREFLTNAIKGAGLLGASYIIGYDQGRNAGVVTTEEEKLKTLTNVEGNGDTPKDFIDAFDNIFLSLDKGGFAYSLPLQPPGLINEVRKAEFKSGGYANKPKAFHYELERGKAGRVLKITRGGHFVGEDTEGFEITFVGEDVFGQPGTRFNNERVQLVNPEELNWQEMIKTFISDYNFFVDARNNAIDIVTGNNDPSKTK